MQIVEQIEAVPAAYPMAEPMLTPEAAAKIAKVDGAVIWSRIEAYTAHRWTPREVVWIVEGPGCFEPTLTPATISLVEVWQDDAWTETTLAPSPRGGHVLPTCGNYRFTATVGAGPVPAPVVEAFRRLAEYLQTDDRAGIEQVTIDLGGISETTRRPVNWMARAMQLSGAGDLLRPYRRA